MTRGEYVFLGYSDWADLRCAGRGCGSNDSTENMGAWNKGRASHRNGFFHSGLHLCGNWSFWPDHNFRFSSAIPGGYSSGGRNHCPVYGNPAAILTFLFAFSWFGIAGDNTKAGGQLPEDEPDFRSSIELVWNPCFYKGNPDMKLCEKVKKGAGIR